MLIGKLDHLSQNFQAQRPAAIFLNKYILSALPEVATLKIKLITTMIINIHPVQILKINLTLRELLLLRPNLPMDPLTYKSKIIIFAAFGLNCILLQLDHRPCPSSIHRQRPSRFSAIHCSPSRSKRSLHKNTSVEQLFTSCRQFVPRLTMCVVTSFDC